MPTASVAQPNSVLSMPQKSWPEGCRFFDPGTSRPDTIRQLLAKDTQCADYRSPSRLSRLVMHNGECLVHETLKNAGEIKVALPKATPSPSTTVIYIQQTRLYFCRGTACAIALDSASWLKVLEHFEVLPSFVELMHDKNGGSLHVVSYAGGPGIGGTSSKSLDATAFHVAYKIGGWLDHENAVYARHDLVTGDTFVLVVGLVPNCLEKMQLLYESKPTATMFDALYELISTECDLVEKARCNWDFDVQDLESKTGLTGICVPGIQPLPPRELAFFNKDGYVVLDGLRDVSWGSTLVGSAIQALASSLNRYETVLRQSSTQTQLAQEINALRDAFMYKMEIAKSQYGQIQHLRERVRIQLDGTRSLIVPRINSEIASAMKKDSELMRGIAAVTMIFLPATFVATFFSMVFFHVGDESSVHLMVDHGIWMYAAAALPLTAGVAIWYLAWSSGWHWPVLTLRSKRKVEASLEAIGHKIYDARSSKQQSTENLDSFRSRHVGIPVDAFQKQCAQIFPTRRWHTLDKLYEESQC